MVLCSGLSSQQLNITLASLHATLFDDYLDRPAARPCTHDACRGNPDGSSSFSYSQPFASLCKRDDTSLSYPFQFPSCLNEAAGFALINVGRDSSNLQVLKENQFR